jgi:hypothetical protein
MNAKTIAQGQAARATLAWLHGREVPRIALGQPVDHRAEHEPQGQEAIESEISLVLACVVGEMLHLGADGRHLAADRDDVQRAIALAARLGDGDPVDHLEPIFDDVVATLTSPRIKHSIAVLAGAILRAPAGEMAAEDVLEKIVLATAADLPIDADQSPPPRKIFVR